ANNNKRIKILEQMAENLYKEWFVRFRFPGYETAGFVDGVPKAWMFKRVEQIGKIVAGGTPSTKIDEYWNGDIPWLTPADLSSFSGIYISRGSIDISELGLRKSSAVMLPTNTVLLSSRAPIGYVALAKNPIATNQGFKSVICNEDIVNCYYLFYFFKMNKSLLESFGSGATFLELSAKGLSRMKILIPSFDIQNKFGKFISKIADEVDMLQQQNQNLIKQCDYLLPRLMSGKVQVK
ncbi:restriction endonuclease subunit S, partial [Selenomonas sp. AE3005]|uniref:restriction endonuclease subunit S n=1 Tax=Selenomonas sp. AE3005 TaxID=1485543 RepID=UPI0025FD7A66